jgi:hypothetical protein
MSSWSASSSQTSRDESSVRLSSSAHPHSIARPRARLRRRRPRVPRALDRHAPGARRGGVTAAERPIESRSSSTQMKRPEFSRASGRSKPARASPCRRCGRSSVGSAGPRSFRRGRCLRRARSPSARTRSGPPVDRGRTGGGAPHKGPPVRDVRRLLLRSSGHHLYYQVVAARREIRVVYFRHARRRPVWSDRHGPAYASARRLGEKPAASDADIAPSRPRPLRR